MRLTKIKLAGFKSFVDPTTIRLTSPLTGIVGPNGCGKSNIIDAVRWVMGESSAKFLRGDSMADVIFNGSSARKPVGHASIELVFDNSDGTIKGQYAGFSEISVRRQVSRDGQSQYFLNGSRCRRRDITDIFLGTGLGPRSYSIIEQGMITRVIDAKPEELRMYLEEAAGISKYKERRRETENRIRHTEENLSRLNDLREELSKQLEKLKRQARTAERYQELKARERRVRAELIALRYREQGEQAAAQAREIGQQETVLEGLVADQRRLEARIEQLRAELAEANEALGEVQGRYYGAGAEIGRVEQAIQHARDTRARQAQELEAAEDAWNEAAVHIRGDEERLAELEEALAAAEPRSREAQVAAEAAAERLREAEAAMADWRNQWAGHLAQRNELQKTGEVERTRINHLEQQMERSRQRLERLAEERGGLDPSALEVELAALAEQEAVQGEQVAEQERSLAARVEELDGLARDIEQTEASLSEERRAFQEDRGRLASLRTLQQAALGQAGGALGAWLEGHGLAECHRLAEVLEVEPGWERAAETVLGDWLEAVCLDRDPGSLVNELAGLNDSRVGLLAAAAVSPAEADSLASRVRSPWLPRAPLAAVRAVEGLEEALALRPTLGPGESVITRDGVWLGPHWVRVARPAEAGAGVLEREREINALEATLAEREARLDALQAALEGKRRRRAELEAARTDLQRLVNEAHRRRGELVAQRRGRETQLEQIRHRLESIQREEGELSERLARDQSVWEESRSRLHQALAELEALDRGTAALEERRRTLETGLDQARAEAGTAGERAHRLAVEVETMRTARESTEYNLGRMRAQQGQLEARRQRLRRELEEGEAPLAAMAEELERHLARRSEVEQALRAARQRVETLEQALREADQARLEVEQRIQAQQEQLGRLRLAWQEVEVRRQTLLEQLAETGFELQALYDEMPEEAAVAPWTEELERLGQRIQRLGAINLAAIEEYEEQSQRKEYLDAQHADLTEALDTLQNAMRRIDRETRARFRETFDRVNAGLQRLFPRLFGGGQAYLELTGEDLLDTGVTVMARPPGKRNSTIHLLSGGEKALTAVSLVFAIFELNPSPFCLLDEVDAPLDDANVGRFCDLVAEMSERVQFIFITHNKVTMELAHQLMGVTMHEPGVSRLVSVDVDEAARMAAV